MLTAWTVPCVVMPRSLCRDRLLYGRRVALDRGPAHVARLAGRERPPAMPGLAGVPDDEVVHLPLVRIDELALRGVLGQIAQQEPRLGQRPANDGAGVRRQVKRFAPGPRHR